jgi:hypothetical protein
METFAGFVFDGAGVILQAVDVAVQQVILFLELEHLALQGALFFTLVGKGGEAVLTEDDAVGHDQGEDAGGNGRSAATP